MITAFIILYLRLSSKIPMNGVCHLYIKLTRKKSFEKGFTFSIETVNISMNGLAFLLKKLIELDHVGFSKFFIPVKKQLPF